MSFPERDFKSKLDEMEAEINAKASSQAENSTSNFTFPQVEINPSPQVQGWIDSTKNWFATLPQVGKAGVVIGGVWLGFSIVGAVLHVVSSIVTIGFVGLLLYVGYRLFNK